MTAPQKTLESPDGLAGQSLGAAPCSAIVRVIGYTDREGMMWDMVCQSDALGTITVDPWVGCALEQMTDDEKRAIIGREFEMRDFWQHTSGVWLCHVFSPNEKAHPTAAGGTGGAQKGLWNMSKTSNGKEKRQLRVQRMVRSPVVLSQKQLREYVPGGGCRCAAWNESECACGVDWTPTEIYRLRLTIKSLRAKLRRMRTPNAEVSHGYAEKKL